MKKRIVKFVLNMILKDKMLLVKVFLYLAEKLVERTDNQLDDELLRMLREYLGNQDTSDLK